MFFKKKLSPHTLGEGLGVRVSIIFTLVHSLGILRTSSGMGMEISMDSVGVKHL